MALQRGDKITSLEGVDFGDSSYAVVLDVEEDAKDSKTLISLFWPEQGVARRYKISDKSVGVVDPSPPKETVPEETDYDIPGSAVDELRMTGPGRSEKTIREFIPDTYFVNDPNYPSTMTDVLWRPTVRWTPFPRFYHVLKQAARGYTQLEVDDLVSAVGGLTALKQQYEYSEDVYQVLMRRQQSLMDKLFDAGYEEIGEVDATQVMDWADSHFNSREAFTMLKRRASFSRRAAPATLGQYFEDRLELDFTGMFEKRNGGHGGAEELYNLDLTSHVGLDCKKLIDRTMPLIKVLNEEYSVSAKELQGVGEALMQMFEIWYYG